MTSSPPPPDTPGRYLPPSPRSAGAPPRPLRPVPPPRDSYTPGRPPLFALLLGLVPLALIVATSSGACSAQQQRQARQIFEVADQSCAVLKAAGLSDPRLEGVCMTGDELRIAVEAVLRAREAAAAVAGAGSLPAPRSATPPPSAAPPAPSAPPAAAPSSAPAASSSARPPGSAR